jgi:ubiquinone/menaquinone biosynthesis C-methylase UbiE
MAQERFLDEHEMADILEQWRGYFRLLDPRPGDRVLDIGCHEGDAIALLLQDHADGGPTVGLDRSAAKCERARARFAGEARVTIVEGDAVAAPFESGAFDRIYCADMLEWTSDPSIAIAEIRRMLTVDGVALIIHTDFDTQVIAADDLPYTRSVVHAFTDQGRRGTIGRELFALCTGAGFARVEPLVYTLVGTSFAPDLYPRKIVEMMRTWIVDEGSFDPGPFDAWLNELENRDRSGRFFYSVNRNICRCSR